ncbi:MAG: phosphoribosylformylglycinamidine cyclo-ligase [Halobacteriota archaeon]
MSERHPYTYADSGVDIAAEEEAIAALIKHFKIKSRSFGNPIKLEGAYAGLLDMGDFVLGMTTDGVGSKVLVATEMADWRTIGIDCVAMNVNDLYALAIEPIAFVDYLALESIEPTVVDQIGQGLEEGARRANISIIAGETASLPDIIRGFDLAGSCIGVVKKHDLITGSGITKGDAVIGIPSNGIHSNGLTLARKLLSKYSLYERLGNLDCTLGQELLKPTRIYSEVLEIARRCEVHGMAHITGGGLLNLRRLTHLGFDLACPFEPPEIFGIIEMEGVEAEEMYKTFNMGMGFTIVAPPREVDAIISLSRDAKQVGTISERGICLRRGEKDVSITR